MSMSGTSGTTRQQERIIVRLQTTPGVLCQVDFVRECDAITQFHGRLDGCIPMTHAPSRMLKEDERETQAGEKPSF